MADAYQCEEDPVIVRLRREIAKEQVTKPIDLYQPGSPHLERLYVAIEQANRWTSPSEIIFNL